MKKRIVALVLMLVMVLSLAACAGKSKAPSLTEAFDAQADMTTGVSEMTLDFSFTALSEALGTDLFNTISLKVNAVAESVEPVKASSEVSYKYGTQTEYTKLTTLIVENEDVYVNVTELKTAVTAIAADLGYSQMGVLLAMFPTEEYVRINQAELLAYASDMGIDMTEQIPTTTTGTAEQQAMMVIVKQVIKFVEESTKEVTPAAVSGEGNKVTFTVSNENIVAVCDAMAKADIASYYDTMVKELEAIDGADDMVTAVKDAKEDVIADMKEALGSVEQETVNEANGKVVFSLETSGKEGNRVANNEFSFELKDETETMTLSMKGTTTEAIPEDKKVVVPEKSTSYIELMESIMSMLGGEEYSE